MVIDTSAIMAAIAGEPDQARYREAIKSADIRLLSAVTMLEAQIVLFARLGPPAITAFHELIDQAPIVVVPDARTPKEIIGYDEHGVSVSAARI